jgi:hypothetical protein
MKIHSTHPRISGQTPGSGSAFRLLAICGAVALCVTAGSSSHAQSGLFGGSENRPTSGSPSSGSVRQGLFTHGNEDFRIVSTAAYRTAADVGTTEANSIAQVGHGSCSSCGTSCGGSCGAGGGGSCGAGGCGVFSACGACGGNCGEFCNYTVNPCESCNPYWYASFDALYMERDGDSNFTLSRFHVLSEFDYEWAGRVTIGCVPNCVEGCELSYTGNLRWDRFGLANSFIGGLDSLLIPGTGLTAANLSAFSDADFQAQTYTSEFWSIEANETCMGWDIAKLLIGVRYVEFDEDYNFFSRRGTDLGLLRSGVENQMLGAQVGMDLLYPVRVNTYTDFRTRAGVYANQSENRFTLLNGGFAQVVNSDDRTEAAGMFEVGGGLRYQLGEILSVRVGAELWYLAGVATANGQFSNVIFPLSGSQTDRGSDVLISGFTFGSELRF